MKGTSTLHVTEATIIAAVQMYLDDQFAAGKSPVVTGVKPRNGVGNGDGYVVAVEERKVEPNHQGAKQTVKIIRGDDGNWRYENGALVSVTTEELPDDAYNKRMVGGERNDG